MFGDAMVPGTICLIVTTADAIHTRGETLDRVSRTLLLRLTILLDSDDHSQVAVLPALLQIKYVPKDPECWLSASLKSYATIIVRQPCVVTRIQRSGSHERLRL